MCYAVLCCRYLYSSDNAVVAGALLAIGLVNCGVQNENDPGVRCPQSELTQAG
jgi:hypothetical protein